MATRLNVRNETFGQLVRFAIVGFSLAALYSAIYWYLATFVMAPMLAVVVAFSVAVTLGFVLHSRWSFRGHGKREDRQMKVKFLLVQGSGFLLNEAFTWVLTGPLSWPNLVAAGPRDLRDAARHLRSQSPAGFPLMERVVYDQMAELDERHWWYRARREVLEALIRRVARLPGTRAFSRSAAAQATISRCLQHSGTSTRSNSTMRCAASQRSVSDARS